MEQVNNNLYITAGNLLSVKDLITWLENRKSVNVTIIIQSIGNITNSNIKCQCTKTLMLW